MAKRTFEQTGLGVQSNDSVFTINEQKILDDFDEGTRWSMLFVERGYVDNVLYFDFRGVRKKIEHPFLATKRAISYSTIQDDRLKLLARGPRLEFPLADIVAARSLAEGPKLIENQQRRKQLESDVSRLTRLACKRLNTDASTRAALDEIGAKIIAFTRAGVELNMWIMSWFNKLTSVEVHVLKREDLLRQSVEQFACTARASLVGDNNELRQQSETQIKQIIQQYEDLLVLSKHRTKGISNDWQATAEVEIRQDRLLLRRVEQRTRDAFIDEMGCIDTDERPDAEEYTDSD